MCLSNDMFGGNRDPNRSKMQTDEPAFVRGRAVVLACPHFARRESGEFCGQQMADDVCYCDATVRLRRPCYGLVK